MSGPTLFDHALPPVPLSGAVPMSCPKCGTDTTTPEEAHRRILDLEAQVKALNHKATAAVNKLADYEDEVRTLRAQCARLQPTQPQTPLQATHEPLRPPSRASIQTSPPRAPSRLASLSSFLPGRKAFTNGAVQLQGPNTAYNQSAPNLASPTTMNDLSNPTTPHESDLTLQPQPNLQTITLQSLQSSLETEKALRLRAESNLTQTQTELEELTASLFGQANEMVATERKARAKLEERVKTLEDRDGEKRKRLDRLEQALRRIERVRGLVERRNTVDGLGEGEKFKFGFERHETA